MFLTCKGRGTPFSTTFNQLLIGDQVQCCKLNMITCTTSVTLVFPSSPGSISVFFPMFSMCLRRLHLFVYSFQRVIWAHHVASIHLRGCHECKKWKIAFCSSFRVLKCLCSIKCKFKGWIPCFFDLWAREGNYLHLCGNAFGERHPAGAWAIHPNASELNDKSHTIRHKTVAADEIWT